MAVKDAAKARQRKKVRRLLRKIYAFLDRYEWSIIYVRMQHNEKFCTEKGIDNNIVGLTDYDEQCLYIDYRHDILATLVHECLHAIFPKMIESEVRRLEVLIVETMSPRQARALTTRLDNYLHKKDSPSR